MAHLTVGELKDLIRRHKATNCPPLSGKKADLLRRVTKLGLLREPAPGPLPARRKRLIKPLGVKLKTFESKVELSKPKSIAQRKFEKTLSPREELLLLGLIRLGKVPKSVKKGGPGISVGNLTKADKKQYKARVTSLGPSEKKQVADIMIRLKPAHIIMFKKRLGKLSIIQSKKYLGSIIKHMSK
jgi:hypothetical protein